ncbi:MAG: nucleotidyltransferase domain-containing protein [Hydrogenophilales bacterium]|nr:nucleotidyltransferase domain-containing protein [Hydrogenophilales bacterium]
MLASLLFGTYRQRVLGLLLLNPEQSYHVREIARLTNTAAGTLHKELARLAEAGLLVRNKTGNQVRYSANRDCPVFEELASILRKTSGLVDVLAEALSPVKSMVNLVFVFGSLARGEQQPGSDVDVMLVGSLGFADAVQILHPVQASLQREINPVVYSLDEFRQRRSRADSFILEVLSKPKLFVVGNEDELRKLTQNQTASTA